MGYIHKGKVLVNGTVDITKIIADTKELKVLQEDDGRQIDQYRKGDFEWWYFDIYDQPSGCILKLILHIGTDPLRTRVTSRLAVSVITPENRGSILYPFEVSELKADKKQCDLTIRNIIKIWAEYLDHAVYYFRADIPGFKCDFVFKSKIEGWKPFGKKVLFRKGKKEVDFSWVIPVPGAKVGGDFYFKDRKYMLTGAVGYHDHNFIRPGREHPLYIDDLVNKWLWGKCHEGKYTIIFGDVRCRNNRILPFMVAEGNNIIHSSNNLIECSVVSTEYDRIIKTGYPSALILKLSDESFPVEAEFEAVRILDHKDLLEEANPAMRFLIKSLIARPAYHGIFAKVRLNIGNNILEGFGNYESMVFRGK